ncbi:DUF6303 family protein [Streptomyces albipurpureus]|uniref:DUF6303 family protein n=1 Tax=Streptomyces albipurpureus TaxID=2897419 RepID=A0ABT0UV98_9ACTN|nr:DUF6303 family protein [Streptomyces sp. CWNU-1]
MSLKYRGGWELFIGSEDPVDDWPEHAFGPGHPIPTAAERAAALAALGYEIPDGAEWEWRESPGGPMDRVELDATIPVRPAAMGGAA